MELSQPNLLQENLQVARRDVFYLLRDFLRRDTLGTTSLGTKLNDLVDEFPEVIADRKINEDILEKGDKVIICEAADTLKTLKFS